jgi:hypothetical protein
MVRHGGASGVGLTGVEVVARQLGRRQAQRRRPGSGVGDGSVDQVRWSKTVAAAWGGVASSFKCGVELRARTSGASVTATVALR